MRDQLKDKAYYDKFVELKMSYIERDVQEFDSMHDECKAGTTSTLLSYWYDVTTMRYSRGDSIASMQDIVQKGYGILGLRRKTLDTVVLEKSVYDMYERLDLGKLFQIVTLLAFMVAMRASKENLQEALKRIGHEGEDALLALVADYCGQSQGDHVPSKYPKVYDKLVEVIHAEPADRPKLLKKYLDRWYKLMKPIYWYNSHEVNERSGAYKGYWCFDIALVVMILKIDDSEIADHPYYPVDLVRYYRQGK